MHLKSYQIDGRMLRTGAAKAPRQRQPSNTILTRDLPRVSHCRLALGNSSQVYGRKAGQLLKEMAPRVTVGPLRLSSRGTAEGASQAYIAS
jgi:hypothetical protein